MEVVPIDFEVADDLAFGRAEEPARSKEEAHTRRQSGCTRIPKSDKNYYEAVQLPSARIVKGQIDRFVPDGAWAWLWGSIFCIRNACRPLPPRHADRSPGSPSLPGSRARSVGRSRPFLDATLGWGGARLTWAPFNLLSSILCSTAF
jgi:hypothetical protein